MHSRAVYSSEGIYSVGSLWYVNSFWPMFGDYLVTRDDDIADEEIYDSDGYDDTLDLLDQYD